MTFAAKPSPVLLLISEIFKSRVPNEASCAWEPNLTNFPILGEKIEKIEKLVNQKG